MQKLRCALARRYVVYPLLAVSLASAACLFATSGPNIVPPPGAVVLDNSAVFESSGLARSRVRDDLLWTHNDSGDSARLFAFTTQGHMQALLTVEQAGAVDWEDMCTFSRDGTNYMAIADVGDNRQSRRWVAIYILTEPEVPPLPDQAGKLPTKLNAKVHCEIRVRYPEGPLNCEAIAYDPWREEFLLASKESLRSRIYGIPFQMTQSKQETTARLLGSVMLPMVTGASISDDGQLLALATYGPTCILRRSGEPDGIKASSDVRRQATWQLGNDRELELIPGPPRRQGEAICFDKDGTGLLLTSEGSPMLLFKSDLVPPPEPSITD